MRACPEKKPGKLCCRDTVIRILILAIYAGALFLLLNRSLFASTANPQFAGSHSCQEASWVFRHGEQILETELTTPAFRHMKTGETYSITTTLTYDGSQDPVPTCFFFVDHMHCRVLLDGREVFRYTPEDVQKHDRSRSPGNVYVSVRLPNDCRGRELSIEFIPALSEDIEFQLPNPSFGNFATSAIHTFWSELPQNFIMILTGFLGIVVVLFSTFVLPRDKYHEGLYIGIFATLFSLYNLTESDFDFYVISNPYYTYLVDYTAFTLIPLFLIAFLRERLDRKRRPILNLMIGFGVLLYLAEITLHFLGLMDMREFLPILHITYGLFLVIILALVVFMKRNRWKTQLILQLIPILIGNILDSSVYYFHWQLNSSDSTFTAVGVLVFLLTEVFNVWKYSIEVYTESERSREYHEMAYVDALTGIGNRRAFDVEKEAILSGKREITGLIIASVDVNNLKKTNDSRGHAAGDFLIRKAAEVLAELGEDWGHAYRTGGDEFIVMIYDRTLEEFKARLDRMDRHIAAINSNSEIKLSLALGYETCDAFQLETALQSADQRMYEKKARLKENTK